ncbi:MAG: propanediol utilization protein, partial [Clostridia bacterium]|nr:propanediol utilization protein [Clostridia bacterium]
MQQTVETVLHVLSSRYLLKTEASGRHVHLSESDAAYLFGKNYKFSYVKELSQPGQYACKERIDIRTPKGEIKNVAILMPIRNRTQVEISLTDARALGIVPPIRLSGDVTDSPGI